MQKSERLHRSYSAKPPITKPPLTQTHSLPLPPRPRPSLPTRINGPIHENQSLTTSQSSGGPKLPPLPRGSSSGSFSGGSNGRVPRFSNNSNDFKQQESSTSSSKVQGIVLITIVFSSLIAFLFAITSDSCQDKYLKETPSGTDCSTTAGILYIICNILLCLLCFVIYFLHLIGQCDYIGLSRKRKIICEIVVICILCVLFVTAIYYVVVDTLAIYTNAYISSIVFAIIALCSSVCRIFILTREAHSVFFHSIAKNAETIDENANGDEGVELRKVTKCVSNAGSNVSANSAPITREPITSSSSSFRSSAPTVAFTKQSNSSFKNKTNGLVKQAHQEFDEDDDVFVDITI